MRNHKFTEYLIQEFESFLKAIYSVSDITTLRDKCWGWNTDRANVPPGCFIKTNCLQKLQPLKASTAVNVTTWIQNKGWVVSFLKHSGQKKKTNTVFSCRCLSLSQHASRCYGRICTVTTKMCLRNESYGLASSCVYRVFQI
jgi:hypothetical protein